MPLLKPQTRLTCRMMLQSFPQAPVCLATKDHAHFAQFSNTPLIKVETIACLKKKECLREEWLDLFQTHIPLDNFLMRIYIRSVWSAGLFK